MPDTAGLGSEIRTVTVPADAVPGRVDRFAADLTGLTRSHVQKLISEGRLSADDRAVKANSIVTGGTVLRLEVPPPIDATPQAEPDIPVAVVYEDPDVLIVDKPAGLVVHPAPGHATGTLVNALLGMGGP